MKLSPAQREEVRMMFGGFCAYCGVLLPPKGWHADHVKAVQRKMKYIHGEYVGGKYIPAHLQATGEVYAPENDTHENLFPSCGPCNIHKGDTPLEQWRKQLEDLIGVLDRNYPTYRHAVRFGQIVAEKKTIVFWFEKFEAH